MVVIFDYNFIFDLYFFDPYGQQLKKKKIVVEMVIFNYDCKLEMLSKMGGFSINVKVGKKYV
jgi:hypothetical protein